MPMSLKCMIGKWLHKGQISQEEYDAVIKKLDGHNKQIRADAIDEVIHIADCAHTDCWDCAFGEADICKLQQFYGQLKGAENDNSIT